MSSIEINDSHYDKNSVNEENNFSITILNAKNLCQGYKQYTCRLISNIKVDPLQGKSCPEALR